MSSTILHSSDEGSKTPLAKKFTYLYLSHESRKNQERKWNWGCVLAGTEVVYWLEMRLCMFLWVSSHSLLDSLQPLFRNLICSSSTDRKDGWTWRLAKVDFFFTSQIVRLPIKSSRLQEQFFFPGTSVKLRPDQRWTKKFEPNPGLIRWK